MLRKISDLAQRISTSSKAGNLFAAVRKRNILFKHPLKNSILTASTQSNPENASTRTIIDKFDPDFYLESNPDIAEAGLDPYEHYINHGKAEGRMGIRPYLDNQIEQEGFDREFYLSSNPDIAAAGIDPFLHYMMHGKEEGRKPGLGKVEIKGNFEQLDQSRKIAIVVSHEASMTGAPLLGFNIAKVLSKDYNILAIFLGDGPLIEATRQHIPNSVTAGPCQIGASYVGGKLLIKRIMEETGLDNQDIDFAVVNSIGAAAIGYGLHCFDIPYTTLVHEFAANVWHKDIYPVIQFHNGNLTFSANLTRQSAYDIFSYPFAEKYANILPQGKVIIPEIKKKSDKGISDLPVKHRFLENLEDDVTLVIGMGTTIFRKGVDLFLGTLQAIVASRPDIRIKFAWIGQVEVKNYPSEYREILEDQILRAGLEQHFYFIGEVDQVTLNDFIDRSDIYFLSSRLDPLPNVAIDAMTAGKPVVCFDKASGIADILADSTVKQHTVADYLAVSDAADKIIRIADDHALSKQVSDEVNRLSAQHFDMDKYVSSLRDLTLARHVAFQSHAAKVQELFSASLSDVIDPEYYLNNRQEQYISHSGLASSLRYDDKDCQDDVARDLVLSWENLTSDYTLHFNSTIRKPLAGFNPGIYAEHLGVTPIEGYIGYFEHGKPVGPWRKELISLSRSNVLYKSLLQPDYNGRALNLSERTCLHIHCFFVDVFEEIITRLLINNLSPTLLISVRDEKDRQAISSILSILKFKYIIKVLPNIGRDIGPMLTGFADELKQFDYIGHVHTKKSTHISESGFLEVWRNMLFENAVGGKSNSVDHIIDYMDKNPKVGMMYPDDPMIVGWSKNRKYAERLADQLGRSLADREFFDFPVGTMFWCRQDVLQPLLSLQLDWSDYPTEPLPIDGTMLHALERIFGWLPEWTGYDTVLTRVEGFSR